MAVVAAHRVVQAALVKVFLGGWQAAVVGRAHDGRVFTVQHDMVVHIDALRGPGAAGLVVRALYEQLVQHCLDDAGHGADVAFGLDGTAAGGTGSAAMGLGRPGVVEAFAAKVVLARELDGAVKGRVADEADEVAVGVGEIVEVLEVGSDLEDAAVAVAALRRG